MSQTPEDHLPTRQKRYGWHPDLPDARDLKLKLTSPTVKLPPRYLELPKEMPPVWDQLSLGSCTGHAAVALAVAAQVRHGMVMEMLSRLFVYYGARVIEGTVEQDAGAQIRDVMKVLGTLGAPPEADWAYKIERFAERPPQDAFMRALKHQAVRYARVARSPREIKAALLNKGALAFGFTVSESFEADSLAKTGFMRLPEKGEEILGGHAVTAVGFDDEVTHRAWKKPGALLVRNSYGRDWGIKDKKRPDFRGHFWFPYELFFQRGVTDDFWTLDLLNGTPKAKLALAPA